MSKYLDDSQNFRVSCRNSSKISDKDDAMKVSSTIKAQRSPDFEALAKPSPAKLSKKTNKRDNALKSLFTPQPK